MNPQEIINLGAAAKSLAESEAFQTVMNELRKDAQDTWRKTSPDQAQAREDMYFLTVALALIDTKLNAMQSNATVEQHKVSTKT